jgi:hypothetical protein
MTNPSTRTLEVLIDIVVKQAETRKLSISRRAALLRDVKALTQMYRRARSALVLRPEANEPAGVEDLLASVLLFAFKVGSSCPDGRITKERTITPIEERARKNENWVRPFNRAVRQAHRDGLKTDAAIAAAVKSLNGMKMPVEHEALRKRERELRTGKKRK